MSQQNPEPNRPTRPPVPAYSVEPQASGAPESGPPSTDPLADGTLGADPLGVDPAGVAMPGTGLPPVVAEPVAGAAVAEGAGRTRITEMAVAKVAAVAARSVPGVYALGTGSTRGLGAIRDAVGGENLSQGVQVEVGETQVAVDINLIAAYGKPLHSVANQVRAAVYTAVERLVGLKVIEVNIEINDVHIPGVADAKAAEHSKSADK